MDFYGHIIDGQEVPSIKCPAVLARERQKELKRKKADRKYDKAERLQQKDLYPTEQIFPLNKKLPPINCGVI